LLLFQTTTSVAVELEGMFGTDTCVPEIVASLDTLSVPVMVVAPVILLAPVIVAPPEETVNPLPNVPEPVTLRLPPMLPSFEMTA
jgi:hypothetical protein